VRWPSGAVVRYERLPATVVMDAAAPALSIGAAIGGWAAWPTAAAPGFRRPAWYGVKLFSYAEPRVPTQLIDMGYNLVIAGVLAWLATRPHRPGDLLWIWFAAYGACRFLVEFLRAEPLVARGAAVPFGLNPPRARRAHIAAAHRARDDRSGGRDAGSWTAAGRAE